MPSFSPPAEHTAKHTSKEQKYAHTYTPAACSLTALRWCSLDVKELHPMECFKARKGFFKGMTGTMTSILAATLHKHWCLWVRTAPNIGLRSTVCYHGIASYSFTLVNIFFPNFKYKTTIHSFWCLFTFTSCTTQPNRKNADLEKLWKFLQKGQPKSHLCPHRY